MRNDARIEAIANAVLYEGYILYPYRVSTKNRQRWTFGGLYPPAFCVDELSADRAQNQIECLLEGAPDSRVDVQVRFLHLTDRIPGFEPSGPPGRPTASDAGFRPVESLSIDDRLYRPWQEAEERRIELSAPSVASLCSLEIVQVFSFPERCWIEPLFDSEGVARGALLRRQHSISGKVHLQAAAVRPGVFKLTVRIENTMEMPAGAGENRDVALRHSLASCHCILHACGGSWISPTDPPDRLQLLAASCRHVGLWPVLVGEPGQAESLLASPIILADYPEIAPESPGDLFDGTEIDEILTLRILTLTDEEKKEAAGLDGRGRDLLARSESLARDRLEQLHGAMRRPISTRGER